jgi:hypothetical protein
MTVSLVPRSLVCALLLFTCGCGPVPEMVLPDALSASADSYEVSGAGGTFLPFLFAQHVRFGPYSARAGVGIESDEHSDATLLNGDREHQSETQSGWFELRGPASSWRGRCVRELRAEITHAHSLEVDRDGVKVRNPATGSARSNVLRCELREGDGRTWQLQLDLEWHGSGAGSVRSGTDELVFGPIFEQKNQPFRWAHEIAGYLLQDETGLIGAFDTGGHPRVWMRRSAATARRELMAAVCVALVLERRFMN